MSPKISTSISGHKTAAISERYNVVADRDLEEAAKKVDVCRELQRQADRTPNRRVQAQRSSRASSEGWLRKWLRSLTDSERVRT